MEEGKQRHYKVHVSHLCVSALSLTASSAAINHVSASQFDLYSDHSTVQSALRISVQQTSLL